jgi:GMP synthase (glutamine-hydrolysing)
MTKQDDQTRQLPKLLLLHNGPKPEEVNRLHGSFDTQIENCLKGTGLHVGQDVEIEMIRTFDENIERLLTINATDYLAVILSGSKFDVTQELPWMVALSSWLKTWIGKVPMLGMCFGHQIIGRTLGGEVMYNPRGPEVGTYHVELIEAARSEAALDPLVSKLPPTFPVVLIHAQSVVKLPPGAVAFYSSSIERHQLVRFAPNTYGTQFHPEYTTPFVRTLIPYMTYGVQSQEDQRRLAAMEEATPVSASIVGKFVRLQLYNKANENGSVVE